MGGNGEYVAHKGGFVGRQIPAGPGGGCVKTGPFAKYVEHLESTKSILISLV